MNKKLIFFDVDGTLSCDGIVKDSTISSINKLKELGHCVYIATGRTMSLLKDIDSIFNPSGFVILNGKAAYYNKELVFQQVIDSSIVESLYFACKSRGDLLTCLDTCDYMCTNLTHPMLLEFCVDFEFPMPIHISEEELFSKEICTFGLHTKDVSYYKNLFPMLNYIKVNEFCYDVVFGDEVKGYGCRIVREKLGFKIEDTIAFGDNLNDLDMFDNVGVSVAMGNANNLLKEKSSYVTMDSLDDGIYYALHNYLKLI